MFNAIGGFPVAIIAAAGVALGFLTAAGNNSIGMMNQLKIALQGNHENFAQLAADVESAARVIAGTTRLTLDEAVSGIKTITQNRYFDGAKADMVDLSKLAINLAASLGKDASEGFSLLNEAMLNPLETAKKLSGNFSRELSPAFIDQLEKTVGLTNQFYKLRDALTAATGDNARQSMSPIRDAWVDLGNAFSSGTNGWKPFEEFLANTFATSIRMVAGEVRGLGDAFSTMGGQLKGAWENAKSLWEFLQKTPKQTAAESQQAIEQANQQGMPARGSGYSVDSWTTSQNQAAQTITNVLASEFQATESQIIATIANGFRETGLTASKLITDSNGYQSGGFLQWNAKYGRLQGMYSDSGTTDINQIDLATQVRYMMKEIANSPTLSAMWKDMATMTGADAAALFTKQFENPRNANQQGQISANIAGQLTGGTTTISNNILNEDTITLEKAYGFAADSTAEKLAKLTTKYDEVQAAMQLVGVTMGTQSGLYLGLSQQADKLSAAIANEKTAEQQQADQFESTMRATAGATEGLRAYNAFIEQARLNAVNAKGIFTFADELQAQSQFLRQQSQALGQVGDALTEATLKNDRLSNSYKNGDQAVLNATAKEQAIQQVMQHLPPTLAQVEAAIAALTQRYLALAQSAAKIQEVQILRQQSNSIAYINAETSSVGLGEQAQSRYLAVFKATQEAHQRDGDTLTDLSNKIIDNTGKINDATAAYQSQKNALSELQSFYDTVFSDVGNTITDAFAIGSDKALRFKDVVTSVVNDIEKEFVKLALTNPLKNLIFGTNSATLDSVGGILGSLFGSSDVTGSSITGVGSIAALLGLAGSGSKSSSGSSPFDSSGITVSGSSTNSSSGGISTTGVATSALGLVGKVGTLEEFGKLLSGNYTGNALGAIGRIGSYSLFSNSSGAIGQTVPDAAVDAVNTAGGSVSDTGTLAGGSGAINVTVGQALGAVGGLYSAYSGFQRGGVGGTVQGVTGLASAGLAAASTGLLGTGAAGLAAAAGPYAPIALAAIALISAFLPSAHPLHSYQATEVNVAGGQLGIGRTVSQVESADETINNVQEWEKSINQYMSATKIKLTNPDSTIGSVGEGIKNFTQVDNPNALFSELMFANDPSDTSSFGTGKGALTGMRFNSIDELQNELVKIANFTDTLDAVGIKLESVGTDLTNIRIKEVIDAGANDLRTALSHDLPGQVFANTDALDAEINKVNTFVNSTVPGLLQPVEQTSSSITEAADKVKTMYADAINQATAYGLDYTQKLQAAEEQALLLVRREGIEAITDRGNQLANAARDMSGSTANYLQETMDSFDSTTRDTLEAISKEWTDTYGDAVKTNTGYLAAIAFAEKEFGQERVKAVFEAMNQIEQATASQAQTEGKITSRGLTVTGGQPALAKAALSDAGNSNALELAQYKKTLEQFYGFNFVDTKAYNDKITELTTVQNEENYAIAKKYSDALIAGYEKIGDRITKLVNAARDMYGSTANYYQETMDNFDATTRDTLAAISKEWTDTYGDLITTSTDYLTAMAFAEKELGAERVKAAFEAINQAEQARATEAQTEAKVTIRGLNATGAPGQAALLENDTAAALELAQYKKTLESFYGITYVNTQEYNDKISELERVQGLERVAIVQKYAKDTTGVINLAFEKQHTAYTDAQSAFKAAQSALVTALNSQISATNSQISAIKSNNDALHSASTTIKNFLSGVGTSAESPLTPTQQLSDATTQFKTYVNTALHGNTVAERTGAAGNATNAASTLLQKASAYYGQASGGYADIFKMVNSNLTDASTAFDASAVTGDQQLDVLNKQLVVQQAQLDKANALGKDADTNTAALEAVMIAKFNDMITALYRVNQVDPNAQTLSDADRLRQQGSDAGLLDKYGEALYFQKLNIDSLSATGETAANLLYGFQHGQTGGEFGPGLDILLDRNKIYPPGTIGHYASGGFVKNGTWNKDSVNSELAGGEFVVRAAEAAKFANILPDINSGAYDPDINRQLLNEIKGLKDEVIQLKAQSIRNGQIAAQGSLAVVNAVSGDMQQKMAAIARENLARKRINNG